jgi:hypothetical protein
MAAGVAAELIMQEGNDRCVEEGLLLSAIMHLLGRIALGTMYAERYRAMVGRCEDVAGALREQERKVFPLSHTEVLARLLATWNVPADVHLPLHYLHYDYDSLARVPEPMRTRVELLKLAIFAARAAVGRWESWNLVEPPPALLLTKLGITSLDSIMTQAAEDVQLLAGFHTYRPRPEKPATAPRLAHELAYCDLSGCQFDLLKQLLPSLGVKPIRCSAEEWNGSETPLVVNCLGATEGDIEELQRATSGRRRLLLVSAEREGAMPDDCHWIRLPVAYGRLRSSLLELAAGRACATA